MRVIALSPLDLVLAAGLVAVVALGSLRLRIGIERSLAIATVRTAAQLLLVGLVLRAVFANAQLGWVSLIGVAMLLAAGREVIVRQRRRLAGTWGFGVGTGAMFVSSFSVTVLALVTMVGTRPWYEPQYSIPLLGMLLGNTMTGVALAMNHLTDSAYQHRAAIEERLLLGQDRVEAILDVRRESMRTGMIPILNAMAAAGIVSLPGMMTGQILAGAPPVEAVKYQILIMFLIAAGTGFGVLLAVWVTARRLFDGRHRLRLDRVTEPAAA